MNLLVTRHQRPKILLPTRPHHRSQRPSRMILLRIHRRLNKRPTRIRRLRQMIPLRIQSHNRRRKQRNKIRLPIPSQIPTNPKKAIRRLRRRTIHSQIRNRLKVQPKTGFSQNPIRVIPIQVRLRRLLNRKIPFPIRLP